MSTEQQTASFMESYKKLQSAVDSLESMTEPDVDKIMPLVNQGMEGYKEVKARIDAVRAALQAVDDRSPKDA